ncbi:MAG: HNH endonuclease [Clostridiales bacterium]|nr:HNH endonuclease [Clostridiales bacterium]
MNNHVEKISYVSEITEALEALDGIAKLKEIYEYIEMRNLLPAIHNNSNWRDNVRATLQRHCSQTKSYRDAEDLFYSVYGLKVGIWGLRSSQKINTDLTPLENRIIESINNDEKIQETTKAMLIDARRGQGYFRQQLLKKYNKCLITGIDDSRLLIASHIKPWCSANNRERLSVDNGLILSALYDRLFDEGLISFDKNMHIIISDKLSKYNRKIISINTEKQYIKNPSTELRVNMEYHRDVVFKH